MIKLVLITVIAIMSQNVYSQVSTELLSCNGSGFPFTVQFFNKTATATFRGYAHSAPYAKHSLVEMVTLGLYIEAKQ